MNMVALIPARANSKRLPGKNTKLLGGVPMIVYTIHAALESGVFSQVWVCTDDPAMWALGADGEWGTYQRDPVTDDQADVVWVADMVSRLRTQPNAFAILRPTSPFRTAATIQRAYAQFARSECHSLRAVHLASQHPGKMWWWNGKGYPMTPVCDAKRSDGVPWHSCPTQTLPPAYVQNASLEMAWSYVVRDLGTISGTKIMPFLTEGVEGLDVNEPADFERAERIIAEHPELIPTLTHETHIQS